MSNSKDKIISFSKAKKEAKLPDRVIKAFNELEQGNYVIIVKSNDIVGNPRGRYFAILKIIGTQTGEEVGELHKEYKKMFNKGKSTNLFISDSDWWDYINKVSTHARTFHECVIPDGRDMHYQRLMEIEQEYNKSFKGV